MPKKVAKHLIIGYAFLGAGIYAFSLGAVWPAAASYLIGMYHFIKARLSWEDK
jgi:hypothetical protein